MKIVIISFLLFISVNAQNVWYVDRDATGANTGRSWEDAWNTLDSSVWMGYQGINWAIIGDGDTIYVSGGTDSTTYKPVNHNWYNGIRREASEGEIIPNFNQTVIVARAWHPDHNGEVYFTTRNDDTYSLFTIAGVNNVKLTGFKFVDTRTNATMQSNGLMGIYGSYNTIENSFIYSRGLTTGIYLEGAYLTLRGNFFDCEINSLDNDIDPIGASGGSGNHLIEGNIIITRNSSPSTTSHRDGLQFGGLVTPFSTVEVIIRNNLIMDKGNSISWNALVYSSGIYADTSKWYIYNNILVSQTTASSIGGIFLYQYPQAGTDWSENYYIFNNTIIINDNGSGLSMPINVGNANTDSILIQNNLVLADAPINMFLSFPAFYYGEYYREVNYNGYFEYGGLSGNFMPGNAYGAWTYEQWQADGNDLNSLTGNSTAVIFANKYGETFADYYTETGRDLGVDIANEYSFLVDKFPDIIYDALGNPRGVNGAWDMGALEYQGGQSGNINLKSRLFLEGPYNTNLMLTNLSQNGLLPNSQPYNTSPWNYYGNEILNSGSTSNFVDWVLVELRNSFNPSEVVSRRAAILNHDGTLLNTNGNPGVPFNNVQEGTYYIAVFHRNHLALMSANPVQLTANSPLYDFTTDMNKAYGSKPMKDLGEGKFGMFAGDGNSNGGVTISDRNEVWAPQNGTIGYLKGDFNLDGGVTINDVNLFWNLNNGTMTQVP